MVGTVKVVERRGTWFYFRHLADQGKIEPDAAIVKVAHAALSITDTRTPFIPMDVTEDVAEVLRLYKTEGAVATEDYLRRFPKIEWVPRGGWNVHPERDDDELLWEKVRREGPVGNVDQYYGFDAVERLNS